LRFGLPSKVRKIGVLLLYNPSVESGEVRIGGMDGGSLGRFVAVTTSLGIEFTSGIGSRTWATPDAELIG
jgi:hypothetical protein